MSPTDALLIPLPCPPTAFPWPAVATSLAAFPWPVYQCVLPLLEGVAQEAVRRRGTGELSPQAGAALLAQAVGSSAALNPRIAAELESKVVGWKAQARLPTVNSILRFEAEEGPRPAFA